jgi:hypothetical protein
MIPVGMWRIGGAWRRLRLSWSKLGCGKGLFISLLAKLHKKSWSWFMHQSTSPMWRAFAIGDGAGSMEIDTSLKASSPATASLSIRVDGVEKFSHSTTSTEYVEFNDYLDLSGYSAGEHTVTLYLKTSNKNQPAYSQLFALYGELVRA